MSFVTKPDYSNNRQVKQFQLTNTTLSGTTEFGVPYSGLTKGIDVDTMDSMGFLTGVTSTFSGNSTTTVFTFGDSRMVLGAETLVPITAVNVNDTQTGIGYDGLNPIVIDGNIVYTSYSGVTYDLDVTSFTEISPNNYSGTTLSDRVNLFSGGSLDYSGRTIWVDVKGITRTERLILVDEPEVGDPLTTKVLGRDINGDIKLVDATFTGGTGGDSTDDYLTGGTFNSVSKDLDLNLKSGSTVTVNLDHTHNDLRLPLGNEGHMLYYDANNSRDVYPDYPLKRGIITETQEELDFAKLQTFSLEEVFNSWEMFCHHNSTGTYKSPTNYPALTTSLQPNEVTAEKFYNRTIWQYDDTLNRIYLVNNLNPYTGFISPNRYGNYTFEVDMSSTHGDNDWLGVIIGFYKDPITGFEKSLSVNRALTIGSLSYSVDYNFNQAVTTEYPEYDPMVLADGSLLAAFPVPNGNWNVKGPTKIQVIRTGNVFNIKCSQFGSTTIDNSTLITIDLDALGVTYPQLNDFKVSSKIGFSAKSQPKASFTNILFTGFVDYIFNILNETTYETWEYNQGLLDYELQSPRTTNVNDVFRTSHFVYSYYFKKTYYITERDTLINITGSNNGSSSGSTDNYVDALTFDAEAGLLTLGRTGILPDLSVLITPTTLEDLASTQIIDIGNIGASAIDVGFNAFTFTGANDPVQDQIDGYVLVNTIQNGNLTQYLFVGPGGSYGTTGIATPAIFEDFTLLNGTAVPAVPNLTWQSVSNIFGTSPLSPSGQAISWNGNITHNGTVVVGNLRVDIGGGIANRGFSNLNLLGNVGINLRSSNGNNGTIIFSSGVGNVWNGASEPRKSTIILRRDYRAPTAPSDSRPFQLGGVYANDYINFNAITGTSVYYAAFESDPVVQGTVLASHPERVFALRGKGRVRLTDYGDGNVKGIPTSTTAFDTDGTLIEDCGYVDITLTSTQIKNLGTTPVVVIPAQGAGTIIIIESIFSFSNITTPYSTTGGQFGLTLEPFYIIPIANTTGENISLGYPQDGFSNPVSRNTASSVEGNSNGVSGVGTIRLLVKYRVISL